jgi:hypothetical protein
MQIALVIEAETILTNIKVHRVMVDPVHRILLQPQGGRFQTPPPNLLLSQRIQMSLLFRKGKVSQT